MAQPRNPAAVSGPGALSQRTDGGAGSSKQPLRVPTGGAYGEAGAMEAQQKGAPMAAGGPAPRGASPAGAAGPPVEPAGVFGPTERPDQSIMAGVPQQSPMVEDPQAFLRVLAAKYPHPAIQRLVDWSAAGKMPPR